ncbi:hypothetical protein [Acinetobacter shaoyimingii]|uniref:Uncharacterized protein n=1 Tax=Acinetobacter shaoyimingii TaxID=2715164 RepID=A0A6G8RWI2_9GAMM|nr:hypothetical protein [Acinetobacter shaoyimingii]NHB57310.1 hypothetical protein [Acinetobacter shaoyimingii]QIO06083.1 hypothetical protein G8E00_09020 [Acinetobacter shaoyimingii]
MLVKIEKGFYLNSQHIIAVKVAKDTLNGRFIMNIEYTPNSVQTTGLFQKEFDNKSEAELYLQTLHKEMLKS